MESKGTVLLVEDEADLADLYQRFLEGDGWKVTRAEDYEQASSHLKIAGGKIPFDVILSDFRFPPDGRGGLLLYQLYVELNETASRKTPFIFISATDNIEIVSQIDGLRKELKEKRLSLTSGYKDWILKKPISGKELLAEMNEASVFMRMLNDLIRRKEVTEEKKAIEKVICSSPQETIDRIVGVKARKDPACSCPPWVPSLS